MVLSPTAAGPSRITSATRSTRPGVPSSRTNMQVQLSAVAVLSTSPMCLKIARTLTSSSGWFFAENGSIVGGITNARLASMWPAGTYEAREKM